MSVRRAQREIDSHEFAEWMAFDRLDPIGLDRSDLHAAMTVAAIYNVARDPKRRAEPFGAEDFMPAFDGRQGQATDDLAAKIEGVFIGAFGGRDERGTG